MNSSLDDFHLLRAFLFKTGPVDMTPGHYIPKLPLPLTLLLYNSYAFLIPLSLPTPAVNCLEATSPCREFTRGRDRQARHRQRR